MHRKLVAEAILHCAENSERDLYVGGGGKVLAEAGHMRRDSQTS